MKIVKNTLLRKAMDKVEGKISVMYEDLSGQTALLFGMLVMHQLNCLKIFVRKMTSQF